MEQERYKLWQFLLVSCNLQGADHTVYAEAVIGTKTDVENHVAKYYAEHIGSDRMIVTSKLVPMEPSIYDIQDLRKVIRDYERDNG